MPTYAFRISCKLVGGVFETRTEVPVALPAPAPTIHVSLTDPDDEARARRLTVFGDGFPSADDARGAGERVKSAVMLTGPLLGVGIDTGRDKVLSPGARRADGKPDKRLQPHVHGLQVFPEIEGTMFGFLYAGRPIRKTPLPLSDFEKALANSYTVGRPLTKKQSLAVLLWNQSHFESSDATRFIGLVSAVEALAASGKKSPAVTALVKQMIQMAKTATDLGKAEQHALRSGLGYLRRESISQACRALVQKHVGKVAATDFARMYDIRSKMLHRGEPRPGTDLAAETEKLGALVRLLLVNHVSASN